MRHTLIHWSTFLCLLLLPFQHAIAAQDSAGLQKIDQALEDSEFEEALQLCQTGANANPSEVGYWQRLARTLRSLDRVSEIPEAISPGIKKLPRETVLLLQRAIAYKDMQQFEKMAADAQLMTTIGDGLGYKLMAQIAEANDDCIRSIQLHTRMMECFPDSEEMADWQAVRAQRFAELHVFDWALRDIDASIEADPNALKVLLRGEILARSARFEEAEEALKQFNTMTDKHYVGEVRRLNTLLAMHEYDKLEFFLAQYMEKYQSTDKLKYVADIKQSLGKRRELEAKLIAVAKAQQHPHGFESSEEITAGRERMQKLARATSDSDLEELKSLLLRHAQFGMSQSSPQYSEVMLKTFENKRDKFKLTARDEANAATVRAWILMQADQYEAASKTAQLAVKHDKECADAHRVAGSIHYMMDDLDKALDSMNTSLKLNPIDSVALGFRGLVLMDLGKTQQAATDLTNASKIDPLNPWIISLLERFTTNMGSEKLAIKYHCLPHNGDYATTILDRCDLMLNSFPQLVFHDVSQYVTAADRAGQKIDKARSSLLLAKSAHAWLLQTTAFETGGPTYQEVISICQQANEDVPGNEIVAMLLTDTLRRDRQFKRSLEVAEKALAGGATYSFLMQHIVSLHLALGDVPSATAANDLMQRYSFPDETGAKLKQETAELTALALDLDRHLRQINFVSQTGKAMSELLAKSNETKKVFEPDVANALGDLYDNMRSQAANVSLKANQNRLCYECITTAELREQNSNTFEFDDKLAAIANDLKDGHYWFTVRCKNPETDFGPSFAYFVKLDNGWRIFPQP